MILDFQRYLLPETATIKDALVALENNSDDVLTLIIVSHEGKMIGTLTDGDVRRGLMQGKLLTENVKNIMNASFKHISNNLYDVALIKKFKEIGIQLLPYLNNDGTIEKVYALNKILSILPIDAIIMAGGKGERLRPLTLSTPKPLLKLGKKCIIDYNIDALLNYSVENIYVTVNYLGEQIISHLQNIRDYVQIKCIREPDYYGTIGSVKYIKSFVNDIVLVMNSDLFTNIDYEDFYLHFKESNADMSVAAVSYSVNVPYGIFEISGKEIRGLKEKPTYNYYANAGIYLIKKKLFDLIPRNNIFNATDLIEMLIEKNHRVIRYPITGYWIDIGKPEDYQRAQEFVKHL